MTESLPWILSLLLAGTTVLLWKRSKTADVPKRAEEAPAPEPSESAEILSGLLDALDEACIVIDRNFRIIFANEAVPTLFGGLAPLPGAGLEKTVQNHQILDFVRDVCVKKEPAEREFDEAPLAGGSSGRNARRFSCSAAPLGFSGEGGENEHFSLVVRDVTVERETEQIRKDFVANASHELRTPLSIINGYIENLRDHTFESPEETSRALETMARHGDRIARIVEDMLTISRFESTDTENLRALRSNRFDVSTCAADVISSLAPVFESNKTAVTVDIESDARELDGDRSYWDQILFNLIDNAIKENMGRPIQVAIRGRKLGGGSRQYTVSDDGVGIPAAHVPFVFKRFYRVAKHHSRSQIKGTGLGLSIVKRAVEAHGGTIELTSTPGVDTTFTMTIPLLNEVA